MWRLPVCLLLVGLGTACGTNPPPPQPTAPTTAASGVIDPDRIHRIRGDLPAGYEVAAVPGGASPADFWGFRSGWTAQPPQCAGLVAPAEGASTQGLSGSGDGGLLYVVVGAASPAPQVPDAAVLAACGQFDMNYGRSSATVNLIEAPHIDGAATVGMTTVIRTVVESGTETDSQAHTFTAYLGEHYVFVTLIIDPGSPHAPLAAQDAADLLVKSVSALRG